MVESPPASKPGANYSHIEHIQIRRHGGHIGVPKQWNGGHIRVPKKACGSWTLFLCKKFLSILKFSWCWPREWIRSKNTLALPGGELGQGETFRACASVVGSGKKVYFSPTGDSLHYFFTLLLISIRVNPKKAPTYAQIEFTSWKSWLIWAICVNSPKSVNRCQEPTHSL